MRHPLQKRAIVADDQGGGPACPDLGFQGFDGQDVQVVGGLIQQDDVRVLGKRLGQRRPPRLAARKALCRLLGIDAKGVQRGLGQIVRRPARCGVFQHRGAGDLRLLRDKGDRCAGRDGAVPVIRLDLSGQDPQQGRFAGTIAPHQTGAIARIQREVHAVEQHHRPVSKTDLFQGEDGGSHRRAVLQGPASEASSRFSESRSRTKPRPWRANLSGVERPLCR